jgi:hypothetical protein
MKLMLVVLFMFVFGCCACDARDKAEKRCEVDCAEYGASYVRVSCNGSNCDSIVDQWECWCRRGVESGIGSEPLRVW